MKKILLILFVFVFGFIALPLLALTVDDLIENAIIAGGITDDNQPFLIGEKVTVTADDGHKVILQQLNPFYDKAGTMITICVLCEKETHILLIFRHRSDFFESPNKYNTKLTKVKDYEYVTSYNFTPNLMFSFTLAPQSIFLWLDHNDDISCGCLPYAVTDQQKFGVTKEGEQLSFDPTKEGRELYSRIEDLCIDYMESRQNIQDENIMDAFYKSICNSLIEAYKDYDPDKEKGEER